MDKKFLCVMAGFDNATELKLSAMQKGLYDLGFVGKQTKNIPQHITLGSFDVERELEIKELVQTVAKTMSIFPVTFNSIGIFQGTKVLFAAPDTSRYLLDLKESFEESFGWTPHTTLLIDEPEIIYRAVPLIADNFVAFGGRIEYIYLYEFWPTRCISVERLKLS